MIVLCGCDGAEVKRCALLGFYKIIVYFEAFVHESSTPMYCPPPALPTLLQYYDRPFAQYTPRTPTALLCATHHTILGMAISCTERANALLTHGRRSWSRVEGAMCAEVIRLRVSYNRTDETLSRNSLMYMSKANLPRAVN